MGAGDHAIAVFCIGCGRVLEFLYSGKFTLHFEVVRVLPFVIAYLSWLNANVALETR